MANVALLDTLRVMTGPFFPKKRQSLFENFTQLTVVTFRDESGFFVGEPG